MCWQIKAGRNSFSITGIGRSFSPSFFCFTITVKPQDPILQRFGCRPDPIKPASDANKPEAFHVYSMRQAMEEEFILDVLRNYSACELAFKLAQWAGLQHRGERRGNAKIFVSLGAFASLYVEQKMASIVEHFCVHNFPFWAVK